MIDIIFIIILLFLLFSNLRTWRYFESLEGGYSNLVHAGQMDSQNIQNNDKVFLWRLWNR